MIKENTGHYFDDLTVEKASLSMSKSDSHKGIKDFTTNIQNLHPVKTKHTKITSER